MVVKDLLVKKIESEHRLLEKALTIIPGSAWLVPGVVNDWSIKDLLAHLSAWEKMFRDWYQSGLEGTIPLIPAPGYSWKQVDALNRDIYTKFCDIPLAEIKQEFTTSYLTTFALVKKIPEEDINARGRYDWTGKATLYDYIAANTYNHYHWARLKIKAFTKNIATEHHIDLTTE